MFDFIANTLCVTLTFLLPLYLAHRALQQTTLNPSTADSAFLAPWLTYFLFLCLLHAAELIIIPTSLIPFYPWLRLFAHFYLLIPLGNRSSTSSAAIPGATYLYASHLAPLLAKHEADIERALTSAVDYAAATPVLGTVLTWLRENVLGWPPRSATPSPPQQQSYTQTLLSLFALPISRPTPPQPPPPSASSSTASDIYALLSTALQAASSKPSQGATPPQAQESRQAYIAAQRERLRTLLREFDREAEAQAGAATPRGGKTPEAEFEAIGFEDIRADGADGKGWSGWLWGKGKEKEKKG